MPDLRLMQILQKSRLNGRDNHPIEAMWNSILAEIDFQHVSVESLRRELSRNAQLREVCGFDPLMGIDAVPSKSTSEYI